MEEVCNGKGYNEIIHRTVSNQTIQTTNESQGLQNSKYRPHKG